MPIAILGSICVFPPLGKDVPFAKELVPIAIDPSVSAEPPAKDNFAASTNPVVPTAIAAKILATTIFFLPEWFFAISDTTI